ncbi:hypothetical protein EJ03DRAFT_202602 [Teratosphaeria nubilosa]|uniref:Uncharacterized protein n=1 Tax=Teratosphaeria nubilosa TaxID=161662 RepID=A0A6G1LIG2_9PEZI|nr:hypothetical protein EJ03DRAFT_202602 [Teratosphaeria nubilosa]
MMTGRYTAHKMMEGERRLDRCILGDLQTSYRRWLGELQWTRAVLTMALDYVALLDQIKSTLFMLFSPVELIGCALCLVTVLPENIHGEGFTMAWMSCFKHDGRLELG